MAHVPMTEAEARYLACRHRHCDALRLRNEWVVWDTEHDDEVVFDLSDYQEATRATQRRTP